LTRHIYLIRHGQAGLRTDYDRLSDAGREQARLLGEWFRGQGVGFEAAFAGELSRQKETARLALEAMGWQGDLVTDARWNEFDLDSVHRGIAPQMAAADTEFASAYEELRAASRDAASGVHRRWTAADVAVIRAWVEGRYAFEGESWKEFSARITSCCDLFETAPEGNIAVFTSATPIGIWAAHLYGLEPIHAMRFAGVMLNSGFSVFRGREDGRVIFSYNNLPHITDPALRTFR